ncbi:hypothetical protein SPBR_02816 [Sporothrix brasiliensis 5110]|uniref:Thioester reductase (TE) domain-containing protein n=1 Tax=Sporothrix brasiliensis 5110 TaxID=1398154 RepID=A0A0C2F1I3_9PEZI|nr:uncharacterized protein SPBR_02816 [Sporothrix brasiliensis 5110]KIH92784.1 hypothetical protein SPBR_02816 [Sporothrix brasiliensis 5110]
MSKGVPSAQNARPYRLCACAAQWTSGLADPQRTEFVTVDLSDPQFDLDAPTFRRLRAAVDVVIHNAWKVDFNHSLASFEETHIRGVRHVVDFALASERQPHIFYVSSLSSVANWSAVQGVQGVQGAGAGVDARAPTSVPEAPLDDPRVALTMGYGESKHVAEQVLARAVANAGLYATTLRVGQVAGPLAADGGQWNPTEWLPSLVRTSRALGRLPSAMNTIEWIPRTRRLAGPQDLCAGTFVVLLIRSRQVGCRPLERHSEKRAERYEAAVEVQYFESGQGLEVGLAGRLAVLVGCLEGRQPFVKRDDLDAVPRILHHRHQVVPLPDGRVHEVVDARAALGVVVVHEVAHDGGEGVHATWRR